MAYIGTSPSNGVRRVHTYTATASQTTFSGASSEGVTLSYADTNYLDVYQNGVLLGSADYTATSGTSVVLTQAASVDDLVVIVVYDVFSVADTVSKANGGTFDNGITIDEDGATVLTVDRATSDGTIVDLQKDGTTVGSIGASGGDVYIAGTTHGIKFDSIDATAMYIRPVNNSGSNVTGQIDLGQAGNVFRDAYVSGGVYFAPHSYPANYLDDYEEGTWTPNIGGDSTYNEQTGKYIKIGHKVTLWFTLRINQRNTPAAPYIVAGNPFTNNTSLGGSGIVHYFNSIQNSAIVLTARIDSSGGNINLSGATGSATTIANVNHDWAGNGSAVYGFVTFFSQ